MSNHHIQYFPSNVLHKIFSFVSDVDKCNSVPFVCEKWRLALSQSPFLNDATFKGDTTSNTDDICFILSSSPVLKSVRLSSVDDVVPVLRHMCRFNKLIDRLVLKNNCSHGYVIPEEVVINVLLSFTHLKNIELYNTKFDSRLFFQIVAKQSNITGIDVSLNEFVTVNDLMVLTHNSRLEQFKMSRRLSTPEITDEEMSHLIKAMEPTVTLLHLDMSNLANLSYQQVFRCSHLTNLKMNNAVNLSADMLKLIPSLKNLRSLKIEGPSIVASGDLSGAFTTDPLFSGQLTCLKLEYFFSLGNEECCNILERCYCLNELSLEGCKSLAVVDIYDSLINLEKLMHLNLAFIGKSIGLRKLVELPKLSSLVVDELAYEVHDVSKLDTNINIKKLNRKCKKM